MPNWVKNRLTVEGENAEKVLASLLVEDKEEKNGLRFDFNKILPMPKELDIIAGSLTNRCAALYLMSINPYIEYYEGDKAGEKEFLEIIQKVRGSGSLILSDFNLSIEDIQTYEKSVFSHEENGQKFDKEKALAYGKQAVDNILKYDAMTWYEWCNREWDTKWNACDTQVIDDTTVEFSTAWSDVRDLICTLSEKYPDNNFHYEYCEEQPGYYCGVIDIQEGVMSIGDYIGNSKEAYEMYFDFWGGREDFRYNEKAGTYEYIEDEAEM